MVDILIIILGVAFIGFIIGYYTHMAMWTGVINAWKQSSLQWKSMYYDLKGKKVRSNHGNLP